MRRHKKGNRSRQKAIYSSQEYKYFWAAASRREAITVHSSSPEEMMVRLPSYHFLLSEIFKACFHLYKHIERTHHTCTQIGDRNLDKCVTRVIGRRNKPRGADREPSPTILKKRQSKSCGQ